MTLTFFIFFLLLSFFFSLTLNVWSIPRRPIKDNEGTTACNERDAFCNSYSLRRNGGSRGAGAISLSEGTQETTAAEACWTKKKTHICTLCQHTSGSRRVRACICSPHKADCHAAFVSCQHNEGRKKPPKTLVAFLLWKRWCLHKHDITTPYIKRAIL